MNVPNHTSTVSGVCVAEFQLVTNPRHTGTIGESVVLQCTYSDSLDSSDTLIQWTTNGGQTAVYTKFGDNPGQAGVEYVGRTSLSGSDASLQINNLSVDDEKIYKCSVNKISTGTDQISSNIHRTCRKV
ncbi:cell surface A33 antigen-like [Saccoglossus kowalevskii]